MTLRSEVRSATQPSIFISGVEQVIHGGDLHIILDKQFFAMTTKLFDKAGEPEGKDFKKFLKIAQHPLLKTRLCRGFYEAVNTGFDSVRSTLLDIHKYHRQQPIDFLKVIIPILTTDPKLKAIAQKKIVDETIPGMKDADEAITVICMLDAVPDMLANIDQDFVARILKTKIKEAGGQVQCADSMADFRKSATLAKALLAFEKDSGCHVAYYEESVRTDSGYYARSVDYNLVLSFKDADDVHFCQKTQRSWGKSEFSPLEVVARQEDISLKTALQNALLRHSEAPLAPSQQWVKDMAFETALELDLS